ncbi:Uncharacterised protein [Mycolicibacterium vanbaalenii]|uniref:Acyl-CoA synthetase n=1 Tax=Mycolicibacterium vanbaalenii TaxID=110539 RepID=A0A5S9RB21_MYCVN|nr:acyl-CoA synthetase [Mycolicibacterium vanbaalenii]CAA0137615.1 Uncharacterised protein [Mycolicibacterium vanbaalenii]
MDSGESLGAEREPLDEDDHDLLTFGEVGERLRIEIANAKTQLDDARTSGDGDAIDKASVRLEALLDAASRNSAGTLNDANFEKFFGYPGTAKRSTDDRPSEA